ncbi:MAG: pyridoxine 5'-phosphate synthase [Verrucomicrobia bacterium]|nr:MAG: pyridoxine 5'-phosphate synthase [Verrucomicrobiota bacterium]
MSKILLGVNIDHVATLRQARYRDNWESSLAEPDPVAASLAAEEAGATSITAHLREDRRHIQERDIQRLRECITTRLNLEMGNCPEIVKIALKVKPDDVCLVPEKRQELTTEGGLDCVSRYDALLPTVTTLRDSGIKVSMFIEPDLAQVAAAARLGAPCVEFHTGAFANAEASGVEAEWDRLVHAARLAHDLNLRVHAGHGINYTNIKRSVRIPYLYELNIGHSIVARSIFVGMKNAVHDMLQLMQEGSEQPL